MFIALHQCLPLLVFRPQCQHAEMRVKEHSTVLFVRDFFFIVSVCFLREIKVGWSTLSHAQVHFPQTCSNLWVKAGSQELSLGLPCGRWQGPNCSGHNCCLLESGMGKLASRAGARYQILAL